MALFRGRNTQRVETAAPVIEPVPEPVGKGRPTPKRRDAERRRKVVVAPKNRKEAARLQRERTREVRRTQREGMVKGNDRYLGPRDAGPARAFVRDYVDSRRTIGSYFLPATIVILVLGTSPVHAMRAASQVLLLVSF